MSEQYDEADKKMFETLRQSRQAFEMQAAYEAKALFEEAAAAGEATIETELTSECIALRSLMIHNLRRAAIVKPRRLRLKARQVALRYPTITENIAMQLLAKHSRPEVSTAVPQPVPDKPGHYRTAPLFGTDAELGPKDRFHLSWHIELNNSPIPAQEGLQHAAALAVYCATSSDIVPQANAAPVYSVRATQFENGQHDLRVTHEGQAVEPDGLFTVLGFVHAAKKLYE